MTTLLTITQTEVLAVIREKEFVQYLLPIKNGMNSIFFYCDHRHDDIEECQTLKNKIERLIIKGYLLQFMRK